VAARLSPALARLLAQPEAERRIGPFHLVRQLGKGGFAPVWLAREVYGDTELRTVALKLFAVDDEERAAAATSVSTSRISAARLRRDSILAEARALCQVEHPNIVRFFAIAGDPEGGVLGLAMEHVQGTSLDRRLEEKGHLELAEVLAVGSAVASALAAVHHVGLVHRDVKPANVIDAARVYKLIDFGIAATREPPRPPAKKEKAREQIVVDDLPLVVDAADTEPTDSQERTGSSHPMHGTSGTTGYIDPACLRTLAPATPASDLYSLGAMLYECIAGTLPAIAAARRDGAYGLAPDVLDGSTRPPPVADLAPRTPASLARLVDALLDPDPRARLASAEAVAWELERIRREIAGKSRPLPPEDKGPFRGLGRFEAEDRDVYFGRSVEVAAGLETVRTRGLVALVGASGCGKSSLARAGLLPAICDGELGGWPKAWDAVLLSPGADPRAALRSAIGAITDATSTSTSTPDALVAHLAERAQKEGRGVVLLVDQLEELVTVCDDDATRSFAVDVLARIGAQALPGVRAIVTARRDLLDALLAIGPLGRAIARGTLLVAPLTDAAWEEVLDHASPRTATSSKTRRCVRRSSSSSRGARLRCRSCSSRSRVSGRSATASARWSRAPPSTPSAASQARSKRTRTQRSKRSRASATVHATPHAKCCSR
jgi:serine/threonine protein kinase